MYLSVISNYKAISNERGAIAYNLNFNENKVNYKSWGKVIKSYQIYL